MRKQHTFTRRQMLGSGLAMVSAGGVSRVVAAESTPADTACQFGQPLAQDHVIVAERPSPDLITDDPCLTKLPSGQILATWTFRGTRGAKKWGNAQRFQLARSSDGGRTWNRLRPLEIVDGMPFVHEGKLYLIGNGLDMKNILISQSKDEGNTWKPWSTLFEGTYWNAPTGIAIANGQIYRCMSSPTKEFIFGNTLVLAGNLAGDLLDRKSWRLSNPVPYPGTPSMLKRDKYPPGVIKSPGWTDHWLEPNMVHVRERLMALVRVRIAQYATTNLCGLCDLADEGGELKLDFTQFWPLPGGQSKFHIIHDNASNLYWMTTNMASDSQNSQGLAKKLWGMGWHSGLGNERRFLMLYYSIDALNWFPAGCLAMSTKPLQSFMYACPLVDGEDLLVLSRTSQNGSNQHDADLITFHRLRNFRSLSMPLHPEIPA